MLIGAMNNPEEKLELQIRSMTEMALEFVDLTLEPPEAMAARVDAKELRRILSDHDLKVVGHTPYYLPLASPFESLRKAAVEELKLCLEVFGQLGAKWMNVHPASKPPMHNRNFGVDRNLQSLRELFPVARDNGVGLMIENIPGQFNTAEELAELFDPLPELGLHLDIGHANLLVSQNSVDEILAAHGSRLRHVHLHDNKGGGADLHLPLGVGSIDIAHHVHSLRAKGYDGTITLEVFSPNRQYLATSRDILRRLWDEDSEAVVASTKTAVAA
jgi:sugar phosphate isomerase/epimerase